MELEQQNKPRRRGRPPKNKMDNLIMSNSEIVDDDMDLIGGEDVVVQPDIVETAPITNTISNKQPEIDVDKPEVTVENTTPDIIQNNTYTTSKNQNKSTQILDIERFSKIIGKDAEYVVKYLENVPDDPQLFLNALLDLLEQSCIKTHKYSVGEYVWIPEQIVDRTTGGYGKIEVVYLRKPRKVKVSKVIYTTKICYGFEGFTKLQVLEQYCFKTEEECQKVCEDLNVNR